MLVLWVTLNLLLVLSSCNWTPARGQTCSLSASQFSLFTTNVSAESVNGSTPGAKVSWNTTAPPECVASYRVEFRTSIHGPAVVNYTTTNTSQTESIQTGLQCTTYYYISVVVTGETPDDIQVTLRSRTVQVLIGAFDIPTPLGVRAEVTSKNTSIRVSWQWSRQGVLKCVDLVRVNYQPQGGSLMNYTVGNVTATSATLPNLQCNTEYMISIHASGGLNDTWSDPIIVFLPARAPPTPTEVTAQFTSVSTVRVTWLWDSSDPTPYCFITTSVTYRPEGGDESFLQLSDPAATEATLTDLQCNTSYTITVVATAGEHRREGVMFLPLQGPQRLSAAVLSPTSVHLTWLAPCHTQQYHIYYKGTCGAYVDEGRLDTDHQEYTFNELQEGTNYTFIVNQTGLSGGRVFSIGPVYARTFTAVPSGAPQSLEGRFLQPTEVSLRWREVPCIHQNGPITGYIVRYYVTFGADRGVQQNKSVVAASVIIDGLTPNTEYIFQVAAVNVNGTGPFSETITLKGTGSCSAETTDFLSWPNTSAGSTQSLRCPTTTTIINRTCSSSGVWESVDLSLCTPFTSINTNNITLDNYVQVLMDLSGAVKDATTNEQEQTTRNLAIVTAAFARSVQLINKTKIIPNMTVQEMVLILDGLQQWDDDVLQTNASNIVHSFETVGSVFAQQLENGDSFSVMTDSILFVAEHLSQTELAASGRIFSSGGQTGNTDINTLDVDETAAVFLPAPLFQSTTGHDNISVGMFFAVYDTGVLFPITNATEVNQETNSSFTTVVGSPVLAATVGSGLHFNGLAEPVRILLRLNQLGNITSQSPQCASWDFDREQWTGEGCETNINGSVVTCNCNHLTNFAILVDICSRFQDCTASPVLETVLETLSIIGVGLSLIGIVATVVTLLLFKKLRRREATKFHIQLCIALFCMLVIFVAGIDRTSVYGVCVAVSALIHYFTLVAVMWMGAEAVLMFRKVVIVFSQTTTKFITAVSVICWLVPIIPVMIPMALDLSDAVSRDLVVRRFCFIVDPAVFFGAFLGPIFAILLFNIVIFIMVIRVLIKHTWNAHGLTKTQINKKIITRLLVSIVGVMFLFGLTWLFGALTVVGFGDARASTAFQVLFVILNAFQGFFIFLFFCVFSTDARDSWLELLSYCRQSWHPSQAMYGSSKSNTAHKKVKTTSVIDSKLTSTKIGCNLSTDDLSMKEKHGTRATEQAKEKLSVEIHETNISMDNKIDLKLSEMKEKRQLLERKIYNNHGQSAEADFLDNDNDGSSEPHGNETNA